MGVFVLGSETALGTKLGEALWPDTREAVLTVAYLREILFF